MTNHQDEIIESILPLDAEIMVPISLDENDYQE
jgi:hypothetical protein